MTTVDMTEEQVREAAQRLHREREQRAAEDRRADTVRRFAEMVKTDAPTESHSVRIVVLVSDTIRGVVRSTTVNHFKPSTEPGLEGMRQRTATDRTVSVDERASLSSQSLRIAMLALSRLWQRSEWDTEPLPAWADGLVREALESGDLDDGALALSIRSNQNVTVTT